MLTYQLNVALAALWRECDRLRTTHTTRDMNITMTYASRHEAQILETVAQRLERDGVKLCDDYVAE